MLAKELVLLKQPQGAHSVAMRRLGVPRSEMGTAKVRARLFLLAFDAVHGQKALFSFLGFD
jgi:hypothetical protein